MEDNSQYWLALREGARRLLVEQELIITVSKESEKDWNKLILFMADSMPERLEFPTLETGRFSVLRNLLPLFDFDLKQPEDLDVLWLPYPVDELESALLQMCSELLLAGYPGCSGCGYRDEEKNWDETIHRLSVQNIA